MLLFQLLRYHLFFKQNSTTMKNLSKFQSFEMTTKMQAQTKGGNGNLPTLPNHPGLPNQADNGNPFLPSHPGLPTLPEQVG